MSHAASLEIALGATLLAWLGLGIYLFWAMRRAPWLDPGAAARAPLPLEPKVSIIASARNEEEALSAFLESLLKLDYPDYDVTLVDDDSTDSTGQIADEWATRPEFRSRLKVIHNQELPEGWSGKVHGLSLASRRGSGEWILATDADIVLHPATLRLAMRLALEHNAQLVSLVPEFLNPSFWEKVMLPAFSFLIFTLYPIRLVNDPRSPRALAVGGFMLMRRRDLEALGGYERLRGTVIEDVRMGEMFKHSGRRIYLTFSRDLFHTRMYGSFGEMWEGLSRSAFEGSGRSVMKALSSAIFVALFAALPWVSALVLAIRDARLGNSFFHDPAFLLAFGVCAVSSLVYSACLAVSHISLFYVFSLPVAMVLYSAATVNSVWKSVAGGGVHWKGRSFRPPNA